MDQLVDNSRRIAVGAAFIGVMAGAGGFVGAVAGAMLVLISSVVLDGSAAFPVLMPVSMMLGLVTSMISGVVIAARHARPLNLQPRSSTPMVAGLEGVASEQSA